MRKGTAAAVPLQKQKEAAVEVICASALGFGSRYRFVLAHMERQSDVSKIEALSLSRISI